MKGIWAFSIIGSTICFLIVEGSSAPNQLPRGGLSHLQKMLAHPHSYVAGFSKTGNQNIKICLLYGSCSQKQQCHTVHVRNSSMTEIHSEMKTGAYRKSCPFITNIDDNQSTDYAPTRSMSLIFGDVAVTCTFAFQVHQCMSENIIYN